MIEENWKIAILSSNLYLLLLNLHSQMCIYTEEVLQTLDHHGGSYSKSRGHVLGKFMSGKSNKASNDEEHEELKNTKQREKNDH